MARGRGEWVRNNETRSKRSARGSRFTFITHCSTRRATRFTAFLSSSPSFFFLFFVLISSPPLSLSFLFLFPSIKRKYARATSRWFGKCVRSILHRGVLFCFYRLLQDRTNSLIVDLKIKISNLLYAFLIFWNFHSRSLDFTDQKILKFLCCHFDKYILSLTIIFQTILFKLLNWHCYIEKNDFSNFWYSLQAWKRLV